MAGRSDCLADKPESHGHGFRKLKRTWLNFIFFAMSRSASSEIPTVVLETDLTLFEPVVQPLASVWNTQRDRTLQMLPPFFARSGPHLGELVGNDRAEFEICFFVELRSNVRAVSYWPLFLIHQLSGKAGVGTSF